MCKKDTYKESDEKTKELVPEFFRTYYPMFVSFARNFVQSHETCEDLVQEAFATLLEQGYTFENEYLVRGFLYRGVL